MVKEYRSVCVGDLRGVGLIPGSGRSPGGGHGNPTLVFLPGESHVQRSLVGYSPWGCSQTRLKRLSTEGSKEASASITKPLSRTPGGSASAFMPATCSVPESNSQGRKIERFK